MCSHRIEKSKSEKVCVSCRYTFVFAGLASWCANGKIKINPFDLCQMAIGWFIKDKAGLWYHNKISNSCR